ncbi:MAG TPA: VOC family protein [Opitutaceae bacterium]|nr:VOC family protein [Opitutaceae bacterium]
MSSPIPSLGYVILYVPDVEKSLAFYERAFGLARRFYHSDNGKAYGELETGAARLAFASLALVREHTGQGVTVSGPGLPPLGFEIALISADVPAAYRRALEAGAASVAEPATKPWGQVVAYVRDADGTLVELCTALP